MNDPPGDDWHPQAEDILDELERTMGEHLTWLKAWHVALLCDAGSDTAAIDGGGHFADWYADNRERGLVDQPQIHTLARLDREVRRQASSLARHADSGLPLPRDDYETFMDAWAEFVTRARRLEKAFAAAAADLDPLTGLQNRQAMQRDLAREWNRTRRSGLDCCIALGDLDHFKQINDTYGHPAGDRVLSASAERFLNNVRSYDAVYRYGGEEFLICLPGANLTTARHLLERLRKDLELTPVLMESGQCLSITGSFGVAQMRPGLSVEQTIERADQALYRAKHEGRNRIEAWHGSDDERVHDLEDQP